LSLPWSSRKEGPLSPSRPTAPSRGFTPPDLRRLSREERLRLAYVVVAEMGLPVTGLERRADDYDDLVVQPTPLLAPRAARVRFLYRSATSDDLQRLAKIAESDQLADYLLIDTYGDELEAHALVLQP
jgi:hypothetical protein